MLESIEDLRKMDEDNLVSYGNGDYRQDTSHNDIADAIEREVLGRYMELPMDMYGVPIRIGDKMVDSRHDEEPFEVWAIGDGLHPISKRTDGIIAVYPAQFLKHVVPRTVEDVLTQLAREIYADAGSELLDMDIIVSKYAKELRMVDAQ